MPYCGILARHPRQIQDCHRPGIKVQNPLESLRMTHTPLRNCGKVPRRFFEIQLKGLKNLFEIS